jgi:hypothetical protein
MRIRQKTDTATETKRLFCEYMKRLGDPNDWPRQTAAMGLMVILLGAWLWPENPDPVGWFKTWMIPLMVRVFIISLILIPLQAAWDVRKGKRSYAEAKAMAILFPLAILIVPLVCFALIGILSVPLGLIFRTIPEMVMGNTYHGLGKIVGGIILLAMIPIMWKLMGVMKDTGFQRGFTQYAKDMKEQMDTREKADIYDKDRNKIGSIRINKKM